MTDFDVIFKFLTPLGVGGLLAYVMFLFYRQDFLRERTRYEGDRERLERREDRLLQVIERNAAAYERLAVTIENLSTLIAPGSPHGGVRSSCARGHTCRFEPVSQEPRSSPRLNPARAARRPFPVDPRSLGATSRTAPGHQQGSPIVKAQWTILAYLAADNDLEAAAIADIKEMERVGSRPGQVEIVVQVDRGASDDRPYGDWHRARRYYITRGSARPRITSTLLSDLGETNTGDPKVLEEFLSFGVTAYPAERYALIIWNHGSGVFVPEEILALSGARSHSGVAFATISPQRHRPFLAISEPLRWLDPLGFGLAYDDRSADCLDTRELERVLATGHRLLGRKIDLVGMDACLMAMLEIAWQIRDHACVLVGSEEIEPRTGWPYATILRDLTARPSMSPAELAATIVRRYVQTYKRSWQGVTQSAIDLSRLDELVDAVDCLARVLVAALPDVRLAVADARRRTLTFFEENYIDLHHFASNLALGSDVTPVRHACMDVMGIFEGRATKSPIIAEAHAGPRMRAARGLSIYFPHSSD
ncbi:MAG: clostripain-related cysteine peptidase, partial [Candidatus Rokuibacteriota bacterium]